MSDLIAKHIRHLRAAEKSPKTVRGRERLLWALHRALPFGLAYASTEELEEFLQSDPSWAPWTRRTYSMHMRGFYHWAAGRYLANDPTLEMAKPRKPAYAPNPVTDRSEERRV